MVQLDNKYSVHSPRDEGYYEKLASFWLSKNFNNLLINEPEDRLN